MRSCPCSPESVCGRCASVTHSAFTVGLCALLGLLCVVGACARQSFTPDATTPAPVAAGTGANAAPNPQKGAAP